MAWSTSRSPAKPRPLPNVQARTTRSFGVPVSVQAHSEAVTTAEQQHEAVDTVVFAWRYTSLMHAGFPPEQAWKLANNAGVDVRLAERLLARGCPTATAVRILL